MHGAAVLSIAVGDVIGIAPDAKVIYRAIKTGPERKQLLENHADALRDLRELVEHGQPLDCISTSHGWKPNDKGGPEIVRENNALIAWFEKNSIPVFSVNDRFIYGCGPKGQSALTLREWGVLPMQKDQVAIPVDSRLLACMSPQHIRENKGKLYYRMDEGGGSWAVPFVAGLFVLARQAQPTITREAFLHILLQTSTLQTFTNSCLPVVDMKAFCDVLITANTFEYIHASYPSSTLQRHSFYPHPA